MRTCALIGFMGINGWSQHNPEACLEQCACNAGNFVGPTLSAGL